MRKAPIRIGADSDWVYIQSNVYTTCGIRSHSNGTLYCWGDDPRGGSQSTNTPEQIGQIEMWTSVSLGDFNLCGISDSKLYCFGKNTYGQLGDGTYDDQNGDDPIRIGRFLSVNVLSPSCPYVLSPQQYNLFSRIPHV